MQRANIFWVILLITSSLTYTNIYPANDSWVEETLARMSLKEKIGQMIFSTTFVRFMNESSDEWAGIKRTIQKYHVGGFHIYFGDLYAAAHLINKMQSLSKVPLLIDADFERGVGRRFPGAVEFPSNMAVGATRSEELAYKMGEITAKEARALGIHITYAPVMDINNNPNNPIINTRSYGEDPNLVAALGAAFIRGCREHGLLTTAKHFPGHGNTDTDSHTDLPILNTNKAQLENVELVPFRKAVASGVDLIMTAHISLPEFSTKSFLPATLSPEILTRILRRELNFQGLVVTDALGMGALNKNFTDRFVAVNAVKAGVDILLAPTNIPLVSQTIEAKVKSGEIPEWRIDDSVRRILAAKARLRLTARKYVALSELERVIANRSFEQTAERIAQESLTLVQNLNNLLPYQPTPLSKIAVLNIFDEIPKANTIFTEAIKKRVPRAKSFYLGSFSTEKNFYEIKSEIADADIIFTALYTKVRVNQGTVDLPENVTNFLNELINSSLPVAAVSFGNPYVLRQIPEVNAYLCAYGAQEISQKAAAQAVFGEIGIDGKLPITIPGLYPFGHGLEVSRIRTGYTVRQKEQEGVELKYSLSEEALFESHKLKKVDEIVKQSIANSAFPGAVVLVARRGKIVLQNSYGHQTYDSNSPIIKTNYIFDLASLTKVVATTTAAMILMDRGQLNLDDPLSKYLPRFKGSAKDSVTIRHILTHSSGLPPFKRFFLEFDTPEKIIEQIYQTELIFLPGTQSVYSDIGMILLGKAIEAISGMTLDEFCKKEIFEPLDMQDTFFNPPKEMLKRISPTEFDRWRGRLVHGEVHDENAFALGGVAGHAGLFSTAKDLAVFIQTLLNGGIYGQTRLIKESTVRLFTRRQNLVPGSSRALGWDTPSQTSSSGHYFSPTSYGHTGFTGTSIWVDPERQLFVIFLTNRVYPTRENRKIRGVRPKLHDAVIEALAGFRQSE